MGTNSTKLAVKDKVNKMESIYIENNTLVVTGKWMKMVEVKDEAWLADQAVYDPAFFIQGIIKSKVKADIFTFSQKLPHTEQKYDYFMEYDNNAVIPITCFDEWWTKRIPQVTRKNVRRAARMGVTVEMAEFNDVLVNGIIKIYDESPIRQGRLFWHYGKDFDTVKKENATYRGNSDFICAYYNGDLIGFIKLVYAGKEARIMQIISMIKHQDKRPANALLSKAVEICETKGMEYFIYGKYVYGKNTKSPLTEFKQRNGFEMIKIPRYYVPLTLKGKIILKMKLHHGLVGLIPAKIYHVLLNIRSKWHEKNSHKTTEE